MVPRASGRFLGCGIRSWVPWQVRLGSRVAVCSEGLEAISLFMNGLVLLPGLLLGPEHLRTSATGRQ